MRTAPAAGYEPKMLQLLVLAIAGFLLVACGGGDDVATVPVELVAWTAEADVDAAGLLLTPATSLRGASRYAVVVISGLRDRRGRSFTASPQFAALRGGNTAGAGGPFALYSDDPEAADNPYPDARLVRPDGAIRVPDAFVLRGLPDAPAAATARSILRSGADLLETLNGFSTTAPIRIALSEAADLASATPESIVWFERTDGADDLGGLLRFTDAMGIERSDIAVAFTFPTQVIEDDLLAVRALLRERAGRSEELVRLVDDDPEDDLPLGVFGRADAEFGEFLAAAPAVDRVVAGVVTSPDFRGADGIWVGSRFSGEAPAPEQELDFLLTLPASGAPPYPVVLLQHGFGGGNEIVLDLGPRLAAEGLATIGIDAVQHGRRGNPLNLLRARPFAARDIIRQTIADQMAVLRAIEAGIDIDGDGEADLDAERMSYLGISLGGLLGATLVAVEDILPTAVLNVAGGRVAFLGQAEGLRDLVQGELAAEVGLSRDDPLFSAYIRRVLESGQHAVDPVDGLNYARRWFLDPFLRSRRSNVLLQEGIGDLLVSNESTEALAAAGGLVADTPMRDAAGVSGLWRFDHPGGHGIFARADVRDQAIHFLATDGTEIIDP